MSNRFSYSSAATCLTCVIAFAPQAFAQSTPLYSVTKTVALGAPDRWDFVVFDPTSHKVFVAHGDRAHGLAIDPEAHRLFSSCENNVLVVVNADTGGTVATLPIGTRSDAAAFDPKRKLIFSSNGDGTLSVIEEKNANTFVMPTPL